MDSGVYKSTVDVPNPPTEALIEYSPPSGQGGAAGGIGGGPPVTQGGGQGGIGGN